MLVISNCSASIFCRERSALSSIVYTRTKRTFLEVFRQVAVNDLVPNCPFALHTNCDYVQDIVPCSSSHSCGEADRLAFSHSTNSSNPFRDCSSKDGQSKKS